MGTELVLASTFLVLVILLFLGFLCYKCERSLDHTKHQQRLSCCLAHHARTQYVEVQTDYAPALPPVLPQISSLPLGSSSDQQTTKSSLQDYTEEGDVFNQLVESGYGGEEGSSINVVSR